jgi:predicted GNAT family N-acyltransferase
VGTCRLLAGAGGEWTLGRMAVRRGRRGAGVGRALSREAERRARAAGARRLRLSAQMHAVRFYSGLGYRTSGGVYDDAGIPHVTMARALG